MSKHRSRTKLTTQTKLKATSVSRDTQTLKTWLQTSVLIAQAELRQGLGDEIRRIEFWSILDHFSWPELKTKGHSCQRSCLQAVKPCRFSGFATNASLHQSMGLEKGRGVEQVGTRGWKKFASTLQDLGS